MYLRNIGVLLILFTCLSSIGFGQYTNGVNTRLPDTIYSIAEVMPKYIDGEAGLVKIKLSGKLPLYAKQNRIYGNVEVEITVDTNGNIIQSRILDGLGYSCDEEALRVVNLTSGKWTSGKKEGEKVAVKFSLPIQFKPEQDGLNDRAKSFYKKGLKIYNNKKYENALTFFKSATDLSPTYIDAHFYSGNCYFKLERKSEACAGWKKSIDLGLVKNEKNKLIEFCESEENPSQILPTVEFDKLVAIDSTIYTKDFKFKDGAYRTYDEFRFNSPSLTYKYRSEVKKDALNLNLEKDTNVVLYGLDENLVNKLRRKGVWGYCKEGKVHVLSDNYLGLNEFLKLDIFGGMFLASIQKQTNGTSVHHEINTDITTYTVGSERTNVKLRIIDYQTGEVKMYNVVNFMSILKRDDQLYEEYSKIQGDRNKKNMMYIYLKKFNNNHPMYIMSQTYK